MHLLRKPRHHTLGSLHLHTCKRSHGCVSKPFMAGGGYHGLGTESGRGWNYTEILGSKVPVSQRVSLCTAIPHNKLTHCLHSSTQSHRYGLRVCSRGSPRGGGADQKRVFGVKSHVPHASIVSAIIALRKYTQGKQGRGGESTCHGSKRTEGSAGRSKSPNLRSRGVRGLCANDARNAHTVPDN